MKRKTLIITLCLVLIGVLIIGGGVLASSPINSKGTLEIDTDKDGTKDIIISGDEIKSAHDKADALITKTNALETGFEDVWSVVGNDTLTTTNQTLTGAVNEVNDSLGGMKFGYDETTQKYGYYVTDSEGADTFSPFSGKIIEQTATATGKYNGSTEIKLTFTFSNLKEIIGIKAFNITNRTVATGSNATYFYIMPYNSSRNLIINGNTISVTITIYDGQADFSITAVGYAK